MFAVPRWTSAPYELLCVNAIPTNLVGYFSLSPLFIFLEYHPFSLILELHITYFLCPMTVALTHTQKQPSHCHFLACWWRLCSVTVLDATSSSGEIEKRLYPYMILIRRAAIDRLCACCACAVVTREFKACSGIPGCTPVFRYIPGNSGMVGRYGMHMRNYAQLHIALLFAFAFC